VERITMNLKDVRQCSCCGELRPFPTTEGIWEYRESPTVNDTWTRVKVVKSKREPGCLSIYPIPLGKNPSKTPIWWPDNAQWRKVKRKEPKTPSKKIRKEKRRKVDPLICLHGQHPNLCSKCEGHPNLG
jgi:hypothetical protein